MVNRYIDVNPGHYAYDEIIEATNTLLSDGEPLLKGITYQKFEDSKPYVYYEFKAGLNEVEYTLQQVITPSKDNPLNVFVDGVSWGYKSVGVVGSQTVVTLYAAPKKGSLVSIVSYGVPLIGSHRRPMVGTAYYPHFRLTNYDKYVYWPYYGHYEVVTIMGRRLKRAPVDSADLGMDDQDMARKYIGEKSDVYIICPSGRIHIPGNFENMTGKVTYAYNLNGQNASNDSSSVRNYTEEFRATTGYLSDDLLPIRTDRFFPDVWITREEMVTAVARLKQHFVERFTDLDNSSIEGVDETIKSYTGQKVFKLKGVYPSGSGLIEVFMYSKKGDLNSSLKKLIPNLDYREFDDNTVLMTKPQEEGWLYYFKYSQKASSRFEDIGRGGAYYEQQLNEKVGFMKIYKASEPYVPMVHSLENDAFDGEYVINGTEVNNYKDSTKRVPIVNIYGQNIPGTDPIKKTYFLPDYIIPRAESIQTLNVFRKWCLDRFI